MVLESASVSAASSGESGFPLSRFCTGALSGGSAQRISGEKEPVERDSASASLSVRSPLVPVTGGVPAGNGVSAGTGVPAGNGVFVGTGVPAGAGVADGMADGTGEPKGHGLTEGHGEKEGRETPFKSSRNSRETGSGEIGRAHV